MGVISLVERVDETDFHRGNTTRPGIFVKLHLFSKLTDIDAEPAL